MQTDTQATTVTVAARPAGLALLRQPVEDRYIAQLPKPTRAQTDAVKADYRAGIRCKVCKTWHHPDVVHLDYVGHAATTARLLEADESWSWEPLAITEEGLPRFDKEGGMWIRLTVCGVSRLGYGNADPKPNADAGSRTKEVIGDAIRNAAMRFGWALDLWHKGGDLFLPAHGDGDEGDAGAGGSERAGEGGQRGEPKQSHPEDGGNQRTPVGPPPSASRPTKDEPKPYAEASFTANLPEWEKIIKAGRKTAEDLIEFATRRGTPMTAEQQAKLREIKKDAPPPATAERDPFVDEMEAAERREGGAA